MKSFVPKGSYEDIRMHPGVARRSVHRGNNVWGRGEDSEGRDRSSSRDALEHACPRLPCRAFSIKTSDFRFYCLTK